MICANPDIVVERGDQLIYCAGALARLYAELGGEAVLVGKPYAPIYDAAGRRSRSSAAARSLAIGDGLPTDIRGAVDNGFRCSSSPAASMPPISARPPAGWRRASQRGSRPRGFAPSPTSRRCAGTARGRAHDALAREAASVLAGPRQRCPRDGGAASSRSGISTACIAVTRRCFAPRTPRPSASARRASCSPSSRIRAPSSPAGRSSG